MLSKLARYSRVTLLCRSSSVLVGILLFTQGLRAEEKSVWENATISSSIPVISNRAPLDNLIHSATFKALLTTEPILPDQWFTIDQGKPLKLISFYI